MGRVEYWSIGIMDNILFKNQHSSIPALHCSRIDASTPVSEYPIFWYMAESLGCKTGVCHGRSRQERID